MSIYIKIFLGLLTSVIFLNWYYTDDPERLFLTANFLENKSDNIDSMNVEFNDGKVYLNIHLKKSATCKTIMSELGINKIVIGKKIYAPSCVKIDRNLISIIYSRIIES